MAASDRFTRLTGDLYRGWEKAMTAWWDQVLESPAFLSQLGENLAAHSAARAHYEDQVDRTMEAMHLPSRKDVVRLARIAGLLEDRILQLEDRLLRIEDRLERMERDALKARVDAAEALVAVRETLDRIEARLDKPGRTRARKTPKEG